MRKTPQTHAMSIRFLTPLVFPLALVLLMSSDVCQLRWKLSTLLAVILCVANLAALQDGLARHGKLGERYNTFAALRCEADSVYYGDMNARSLTADCVSIPRPTFGLPNVATLCTPKMVSSGAGKPG